jgi:hypothetical protein
MTKPRPTASPRPTSGANNVSKTDAPLAPKDHYQREKARRARHAPADSEAMESAKREYQALLETNAVKGRGGRPKKRPAGAADDVLPEEGADIE